MEYEKREAGLPESRLVDAIRSEAPGALSVGSAIQDGLQSAPVAERTPSRRSRVAESGLREVFAAFAAAGAENLAAALGCHPGAEAQFAHALDFGRLPGHLHGCNSYFGECRKKQDSIKSAAQGQAESRDRRLQSYQTTGRHLRGMPVATCGGRWCLPVGRDVWHQWGARREGRVT